MGYSMPADIRNVGEPKAFNTSASLAKSRPEPWWVYLQIGTRKESLPVLRRYSNRTSTGIANATQQTPTVMLKAPCQPDQENSV